MKRVFTGLWLVMFIVGLLLPQYAGAGSAFRDVPASFWALTDIGYLHGKGIVNGYPDDTFRPNNPVTRAEAAVMITRALDLETDNRPDPGFSDLPRGHFAYSAVSAIADVGIIRGFNGQFAANQDLTRGQMAAIVQRSFQFQTGSDAITFSDVGRDHLFYEEIQAIASNQIARGFVTGHGITFQPDKATTRAEFSTFLSRALHHSYRDAEEGDPEDEPDNGEADDIPGGEPDSGDEPGRDPEMRDAFLDLNTEYVSPDNQMTVRLDDLSIVESEGFRSLNVTYTETNATSDQVITQSGFKLYFEDGSAEPQYGFFNDLYPGEERTRSYTFRFLPDSQPLILEYAEDNFFATIPLTDSLKWDVRSENIGYPVTEEDDADDHAGDSDDGQEESDREPFTFLARNIGYEAPDTGMTVYVNDAQFIDHDTYRELVIDYDEVNQTDSQRIDQTGFKLYFTDGTSLPQYGAFDQLFPGQESRTVYRFQFEQDKTPWLIEYAEDNFFTTEPLSDSLKWDMTPTGSQ